MFLFYWQCSGWHGVSGRGQVTPGCCLAHAFVLSLLSDMFGIGSVEGQFQGVAWHKCCFCIVTALAGRGTVEGASNPKGLLATCLCCLDSAHVVIWVSGRGQVPPRGCLAHALCFHYSMTCLTCGSMGVANSMGFCSATCLFSDFVVNTFLFA